MSPNDYVFRYEPVYFKAYDETKIYPVARREKPNVTIWLSTTGREQNHLAHVLSDDGLAIFFVTVHRQEDLNELFQDAKPVPLWSVGNATFYWSTSKMPDGVDASHLVVWDPFMPAPTESMGPVGTQALRDLILPALTWWPDRRDPNATAASEVVLRAQPRPLSFMQLRVWLPEYSGPLTASIRPPNSNGMTSGGLFGRLLRVFRS